MLGCFPIRSKKTQQQEVFVPPMPDPKIRSQKGTHDTTWWRSNKVQMPKDPELKFINHHRMIRKPLVVFADFECLTSPIFQQHGNTQKYQQHIACGYGLIESLDCCGSPTFSEPSTYGGEVCVRKFLLELVQIALAHQERLSNYPPIHMSESDKLVHQTNLCHICQKDISDDKVRDHNHICAQYRGPAHNQCNQAYRLNRDITVVFHNLRHYDGHLIVRKIRKICKHIELEIGVAVKGMVDNISFSIKNTPLKDRGISNDGAADEDYEEDDTDKEFAWKLQFVDSFQFLTSYLETLVSNLDRSKFEAMVSQFNGEQLLLLLRKGVFQYEWLNKCEKFSYPLPMKAQFFSKLNNTHISDENYAHAMKIWQTSNMSNMSQYHDLYLATVILLLADVFEGFREFCLANYKLDPAHYMSLPSFGRDVCLKMTDVKLESLQEPEMYTFIESGIRGG